MVILIRFQSIQFAGGIRGMLGLCIGVYALGLVQLIEFILIATYSKAEMIAVINTK